MPAFLVYGATGFVGEAICRLAKEQGLEPILAGRDVVKLKKLTGELGFEYRVFNLRDPLTIDVSLKDVSVALNCAGPFVYTAKPMVEACLRTGTHYLDITGELPVYQDLASRDREARAGGIMLLPGAGFDVVPTDCLAMYLKQRLPSATHLTLAHQVEGPASFPPGTQRTYIELMPYGDRVRRNGQLELPREATKTRLIDFGKGPVRSTRLTWGDVCTAYTSTGIPNIEDYAVLPKVTRQQKAILDHVRPLFKLTVMRKIARLAVKPGPTMDERARTFTHVWGEVEDDQDHKATARLHGPEAGVVWTARAALAAVRKVLAGDAPPGYQTPALAYGADFVLECEGVTREDL